MTRTHALLAAAVVLAAVGCKKSEDDAARSGAAHDAALLAAPPLKVETARVEIGKMPKHLTLTGSVIADRQSDVAANVAGRLVSAPVERGQRVTAGQPLAVVDARAAGYSATAASAQAKAADTQADQAKEDCERADRLFSKGAISEAEHDRLRTQCKAQLYTATAARANADVASKLAGDTVIRAPFAGVVGERFVNPGEYVQPPTKVASIYALDPVRVTVSVPETAVRLVSSGQTLDVHVAAYPDRTFPAVVRYVSPTLRPSTRDLVVEARAPNKEGALRAGMFATVELLVGEEELPTVPADAVRTDGTVKRLFLARSGRAFEMVVRTGVADGGRVALLEPLDASTTVIRMPPAGLRDGAAIETGATASASADAPPGEATPVARPSGKLVH